MPRASPVQTNFTGGEWSPRLAGRVDLSKYFNSLRSAKNGVVLPHGGFMRRSGTRFVAEVKDSTRKARLVPFQFSVEQAYVLQFGHLSVRFFTLEGRLEDAGSPVEVVTPYTEDEIFGLAWAQSADVLYVVHPEHAPRKLQRTSATTFSLNEIDFIDGPYLEENTDNTKKLQPSAATGSVSITATGFAPFASTDVGRLVRIKHGSTWGYASITGFTSATEVTADVKGDFGGTTPEGAWRLGLWSKTTGYPAAVTFHEERLYFGGPKDNPQRFDGSRSGDFENFTPGTEDDQAVAFTIASNQVNAIRWMLSARALLIGTAGGEFTATGGGDDDPITPTNINVRRRTGRGSEVMLPVLVDSTVLFVQRGGRKLREFVYSLDIDNFLAPDLTLLAEHITAGGIVELDYAQDPDSTVWAVRGDGILLGMTYLRDQEVVAWHRHSLGGVSDATGTPAKVESLAVIPAPPSGPAHDQVWLVVQRYIGGAVKRYVEFMEEPFADQSEQNAAFFVDCGLTYDGGPATTISGLDHLEGETVQVLADGAAHPDRAVSGGIVTLALPASEVHAGLGYVTDLETQRFEAGSAEGTAQGKRKRIHKVALRVHNTLGLLAGPDENSLDRIEFRRGSDPMDQPPAIFSGDKELSFPGGFNSDARVFLRQDQPLPLTVLAVMPRLWVSDG